MKTHNRQAEPAPYLIPNGNELLSVKELADQIKRTPRYVSAMRRDGFPMPGSRATVNHALRWLAEHPKFIQNRRNSTK